jgi:hypothetical protein
MPHTSSSDTASPALGVSLFAGPAAFALAVFVPGLTNDAETSWHIHAGQWMIAHLTVLRVDIFSYTLVGESWHTQEWLAEIAMALSWHVGWVGVHLLFGACAAVAVAAVAHFVRRRLDLLSALLAVLLGLFFATASLLTWPHLLTLPLLALWTKGLGSAKRQFIFLVAL